MLEFIYAFYKAFWAGIEVGGCGFWFYYLECANNFPNFTLPQT